MRIALLELPARFAMPERALADAEELLAGGPEVDLALLPEASLTGYVSDEGDFDLTRFAEPLEGPLVERVRGVARRAKTHVGAPLVEREGASVFNAFVVVGPDGAIVARYRKRHPWFPETWATPGDTPYPVFEIAGVRVTVAVCFDVHFLEREAADVLAAADVLLFPSAWVEGAHGDERARLFDELASRFGVTIANANWGPGRPRVRGQGGSRFVGPRGEIARASSREGAPLRLDARVEPKPC